MGVYTGQHQSSLLGFHNPLFETYVHMIVLDSLTFEKISLLNDKVRTRTMPKKKKKIGSGFFGPTTLE